MQTAWKILLGLGALVFAAVFAVAWIIAIWPMFVRPIVVDRNIAVTQNALRARPTRDQLQAMLGHDIPKPDAYFGTGDPSVTIIEYNYKEEICKTYIKDIYVKWSHGRVASSTVGTMSINCFN
jgi:hypothetical protein